MYTVKVSYTKMLKISVKIDIFTWQELDNGHRKYELLLRMDYFKRRFIILISLANEKCLILSSVHILGNGPNHNSKIKEEIFINFK